MWQSKKPEAKHRRARSRRPDRMDGFDRAPTDRRQIPSTATRPRDVSRVDATNDLARARVDAVVANRAPSRRHGGERGARRGARVDRGRGARGRGRRRAREERLREIRESGGGDVRASRDRERCRGGGAWSGERDGNGVGRFRGTRARLRGVSRRRARRGGRDGGGRARDGVRAMGKWCGVTDVRTYCVRERGV